MQIIIKAAAIGPVRWLAFAQDADLSAFDQEKIGTWTIDFKRPSTGSLIDVNSSIEQYGAKRTPEGKFADPLIGSLAYELAFGVGHITAVSGPCVSITGEITGELLEQVPHEIMTAFVNAVDPTTRITNAEVAGLKKKEPIQEARTGEAILGEAVAL